ncbi:MAG: DUF2817 domain-containing protein [Gammaproteobacteria bacterium]|nr:DUF2817 domain-containing protein [Gammaproteobacteria bacterium]
MRPILTTAQAACFSATHAEASGRFEQACAAIGADLDILAHPAASGPREEPLAIRVARIGSRDARKVLLAVSGTHGQESFAGSATMLDWMGGDGFRNLPGDVAVLFVHGLNPYGWAHGSRANENNVDLNRNFMDHERGHAENPVYERLHGLLTVRDVSETALLEVLNRLADLRRELGETIVLQAMLSGQYTHPDGRNYGGVELQWSNRRLQDIVEGELARAEVVAVIDWHTGLGEFGKPHFLSFADPASDAWALAVNWWGEHRLHNDERYSKASGMIVTEVVRRLLRRGVAASGVVIEWGTYSLEAVVCALFMDQWLRFECRDQDSPEAVRVRTQMMERFYPSVPEWRASLIENAREIYSATLRGLRNWH